MNKCSFSFVDYHYQTNLPQPLENFLVFFKCIHCVVKLRARGGVRIMLRAEGEVTL